jgi:hypothetical protein
MHLVFARKINILSNSKYLNKESGKSNSTMIVIKLEGGLGNQMFQYAFVSILAKRNKALVLIDKSSYGVTEKIEGYTPRNFELSIFDNSYTSIRDSELLHFYRLSKLNKIKKKLGFNYPKIFEEFSYDFQPKALLLKAPVYLKGYYQSYKYFQAHQDLVASLFSFPVTTLDSINLALLEKIKNGNTISVHIRRGDYVSDKKTQEFHGNCTLDYYLEAISLFASQNSDFELIFFSDDSEWAKKQFENLPYSKTFVDHNNDEHSWKDMFLMRSCKHNIIANSSFSWWAAWLNENPNKTVIAPKKWFAAIEKTPNDLIPPQWIRL